MAKDPEHPRVPDPALFVRAWRRAWSNKVRYDSLWQSFWADAICARIHRLDGIQSVRVSRVCLEEPPLPNALDICLGIGS